VALFFSILLAFNVVIIPQLIQESYSLISAPPVSSIPVCKEFLAGPIWIKICAKIYPREKRVHTDMYLGSPGIWRKVAQSDLNPNKLNNNVILDMSASNPGRPLKVNFYDVVDWTSKSYKVQVKVDTRTKWVSSNCSWRNVGHCDLTGHFDWQTRYNKEIPVATWRSI
jgi:hypothetical protein